MLAYVEAKQTQGKKISRHESVDQTFLLINSLKCLTCITLLGTSK